MLKTMTFYIKLSPKWIETHGPSQIAGSGLTSLLLSTSLNLSKCALTAARLSSSTKVNRLWTARDVILREEVVSMTEPWPAAHRWRVGGEADQTQQSSF